MKAFLSCLVLSIAAVTMAKTVVIYPDRGDNDAKLAVGDQLEVRLKTNSGTGFRWVLGSRQNNDVLRFDSADRVPKRYDGWPGSPQAQRFVYTAVKAGNVRVSFDLYGPGNGNKKTQTVSASIQIDGRSNDDKVQVYDRDNGSNQSVQVGQWFIVRLTTNPGTGYSWKMDSSRLSALQFDSKEMRDPKNDRIGSSTVMVFRFKGRSPGNDNLNFSYVGPNGRTVGKRWSCSVTVRR